MMQLSLDKLIPSLAIIYCAQDLISGQDVAVKLTQDPTLLEHEFHVLKNFHGGTRFLQPLWFGRESSYHILVLNNIATPVCDILGMQGGCFSIDSVLALGCQLVSTDLQSIQTIVLNVPTGPET